MTRAAVEPQTDSRYAALALPGDLGMARDHRSDEIDVLVLLERLQLDHPAIAASRKQPVVVDDVGDAAAHAGGEVAPGATQDDDAAAGHVLASVIADTFDDRVRAAVAHGEALAGDTAHERLAAGRAVERDVADDDVLFGFEGSSRRGIHEQASARQPLAPIVVRIAFEPHRDAVAARTRRSSGRPSR